MLSASWCHSCQWLKLLLLMNVLILLCLLELDCYAAWRATVVRSKHHVILISKRLDIGREVAGLRKADASDLRVVRDLDVLHKYSVLIGSEDGDKAFAT